MTPANANRAAKPPPNDLGLLLRHWRDLRGVSQLDLSFNAGVSQRHISFIESGRSVPSRQMLLDIAQTLDVPLRDRNALLLAAGYAPIYADTAWNALEMQSVTKALERMLRQHEPFPALVMDRYWNVLMTNDAAPRFFDCFIDLAARKGPRNMLHLVFDPNGLRPFIADWQSVSESLIQRVYRESVGRVIDEPNAEFAQGGVEFPRARRSHCFDPHAGVRKVLRGDFVGETQARPIARRRIVDQVDGNHQAAIEQTFEGFIDLVGREFAGKRLGDDIRMRSCANARGDRAVEFTAKKNLPVLRIEADAIGRQDVNREIRREPDRTCALVTGQLRSGRMPCRIVNRHLVSRASCLAFAPYRGCS